MEKDSKTSFKATSFYRWMLNNKVVTALAVLLLIFLNILLLSQLGFIFKPIGDFLGVIALPVILAAVFYYLLNPLVDFLEKRKVPRLATISGLFLILAGLIVWGLYVAIPNMVTGIVHFSNHVPHYVAAMNDNLNDLLKNKRFEQFRPQVDSISKSVGNSLIDWSKSASTSFVSSLADFISKTTSVVISIIIFPFVLFYLLRDGKHVNGHLTQLLPTKWRESTSRVLTEINQQISNFVRGQILVGLSVMVMLLIGLPSVGLRYAVLIAIISGVLNLVPFFGFFIALILAMLIAIATGGPWMLLKVLIVYLIEVTLESRFISPLVLGSQLNIHPITILFILLTAGKLFGVWGVLLAIPIYAALKVIVTHVYHWYRKNSDFYEDDPEKS